MPNAPTLPRPIAVSDAQMSAILTAAAPPANVVPFGLVMLRWVANPVAGQ